MFYRGYSMIAGDEFQLDTAIRTTEHHGSVHMIEVMVCPRAVRGR
jgi:hypothetical protein